VLLSGCQTHREDPQYDGGESVDVFSADELLVTDNWLAIDGKLATGADSGITATHTSNGLSLHMSMSTGWSSTEFRLMLEDSVDGARLAGSSVRCWNHNSGAQEARDALHGTICVSSRNGLARGGCKAQWALVGKLGRRDIVVQGQWKEAGSDPAPVVPASWD
jgi:hypothetical protein